MLFLDILITLLIILLVIMIFSGFISLIERKVMATTQNRIGPALFLMGLCTPIFDGIKLILKFNVIILNVEICYLFLIVTVSFGFNYFILYVFPITNILYVNLNFVHFIFLGFHVMLNVINTFLVGCFIINTCFVYLATMRTILCSIIAELCILLVFIIFVNINFYALMNFKVLNELQTTLSNVVIVPIFFSVILIIILYLNINISIFEYAEAESELVAGTITEYAGIFFCLSSLIEIFHIIVANLLLVILLCGGFFMSEKILIGLVLIFILPKLITCRLKINFMIFFVIIYIFNFLFVFMYTLNVIKYVLFFLY